MERLEKRKRRIEQVNCDAEIMSPVHQCDAMDRGSSCEDVENEKDLYPTIECDNEDWANKFTESIRTFHGINL